MEEGFAHVAFVGDALRRLLPIVPQFEEFGR
jgi:hypothetical protein